MCHFLCTSENSWLGSYSKSWRSRWLESCSVPVEGGRDKQHQPSHPRWIDVAKKPKTSNRRAERDVELLCESCNDKTHTIPGYYNKKCKNKQQGIKLLQQVMIIIYDLFDLYFDFAGANALDLSPMIYCNILFCPHF